MMGIAPGLLSLLAHRRQVTKWTYLFPWQHDGDIVDLD